jgi:hypothetical protein
MSEVGKLTPVVGPSFSFLRLFVAFANQQWSYKTDCILEHQIRSSVSPVVLWALAGLPFTESTSESSFLRFRPIEGCNASKMNMISHAVDKFKNYLLTLRSSLFCTTSRTGRFYNSCCVRVRKRRRTTFKDITHQYYPVFLGLSSLGQPCWLFWYPPPFAVGSLGRSFHLARLTSFVRTYCC